MGRDVEGEEVEGVMARMVTSPDEEDTCAAVMLQPVEIVSGKVSPCSRTGMFRVQEEPGRRGWKVLFP